MKRVGVSKPRTAAELADDEVISEFTDAMLHSLVGKFGISGVTTTAAVEPGPTDAPEIVRALSALHAVPRLMPQANRCDADALALRTDFLAHTTHMKKIFKLLHSKAAVELMVRRVGNTIVLDGVLDHFVDSWAVQGEQWTVVDPDIMDQHIPAPSATRQRSNSKQLEEMMGSEFLYYDTETPASSGELSCSSEPSPDTDTGLHGFVEAGSEEEDPCALQASSRFRRVFNWQFKGLDMLLASNHMIWSSEEFEALSLRLHDTEQELGSMSCLDYWLENTMSSIDNTAVCYHRDGGMQGYEIVRTDELPSYQRGRGLGFSPEAVLSHAHSVLQFLQTHCARDGGTYLLSRDEHSNQLELYEVTHVLETAEKTNSELTPAQREAAAPCSADEPLPRPLARKVALLCARMAKNVSGKAEEPSEAAAWRCRRLYQRSAALLEPARDWALWCGAMEGAGDTYMGSATVQQLLGLAGGLLFPEGCPEVMSVDMTGHKHETQAEVSRYLAAGEIYEAVLRQPFPPEGAEHQEEQAMIQRRVGYKTVRANAAAASATLQSHTPQFRVAIDCLRVAMGCLPQSSAHASIRGGLLMLAGWGFSSAAQLGVPQLLMGSASKESIGSLPEKHHPLLGELQEGSVEEVLNRGSMCYLQGLKLMGHTDPQWGCAAKGLGLAYQWLGQHYLQTGRFTKAHRYYMQGVELFRSLLGPLDEQANSLVASVRTTVRVQLTCMRIGLASTHLEQAKMTAGSDKSAGLGSLRRAAAVLLEARSDLHSRGEAVAIWDRLYQLLGTSYGLTGVALQHGLSMQVLSDDQEKAIVVEFQNSLDAHSQMAGAAHSAQVGTVHHHLALHYAHRTLVGGSSSETQGHTSYSSKLKTLHALSCNHFMHTLESFVDDSSTRLGHVVAALDLSQLLTHSGVGDRGTNFELALSCLMRAWDAYQEPGVLPQMDVSGSSCDPNNRRYAGSMVTQVLQSPPEEMSRELWGLFEAELHRALKGAISAHMHNKEPDERCECLKGMYREILTSQTHRQSFQTARSAVQALYRDYTTKHCPKHKSIESSAHHG